MKILDGDALIMNAMMNGNNKKFTGNEENYKQKEKPGLSGYFCGSLYISDVNNTTKELNEWARRINNKNRFVRLMMFS